MKSHKSLNATGQLSIFALLIFQTLFILFAMSLNIALVVHDKINLQNSVDIAAYYGAMKQAEMLNAIAHINYQIRQSWKLLTWRYRVLGSMSLTDIPIWGYGAHKRDEEHFLPTFKPPQRGPGPYFFCVGHKDWGGVTQPNETSHQGTSEDDMLCATMDQNIHSIQVSPISGGSLLMGLAGTFNQITHVGHQINQQVQEKCDIYGVNSWLLGAYSFVHFLRDQSDRKTMIYNLLKKLIEGKDLDGGEIAEGVKQTFQKNLSFINREAFKGDPNQLKLFSSLMQKAPDNIIKDDQHFIVDGLYSRTTKGSRITACEKNFGRIRHDANKLRIYYPKLEVDKKPLKNLISLLISEDPWPACSNGMGNICKASAGMRKTSHTVYYAIKAELDYKNQIFLPFKLTLKAEAFAKPFGGRIGTPIAKKDPLLPPNTPAYSSSVYQYDKIHTPNYSRYPEDQLGLRSKLVHYYWTRTVRDSPPTEKDITNYMKTNQHGNPEDDHDPMVRCFSKKLDSGCMTHQAGFGHTKLPARKWEIAAVAPDLFDVTYFTILPYYQYAYFPKIQKLLGNQTYLRGDLGTYYNGSHFQGTTLLHQVMSAHTSPPLPFPPDQDIWRYLHSTGLSARPPYKIATLNLLLTGWNPPKTKYDQNNSYDSHSHHDTYFGQCTTWVHNIPNVMDPSRPPSTKGKIANGCIYGGRTGYSVKLVSPALLKGYKTPNIEPPYWRGGSW